MFDEPDRAARSYAMTLLSRRAYTEKGLYDKLCTRYDEELAASAVARMLELGLLDDEDYARRHAADLAKLKGFAPRRITQELARKGIDADVIESVLSEQEREPQLDIACIICRKYLPRRDQYFDDGKGRAKMTNALLRLGYTYGDVAAAIRNLESDETYYSDIEMPE